MKISLSWLSDYVHFTEKDPYKIAEVLTLNSAEIENVEHYHEDFTNIVVGRIEEISKHPDADRLNVCRVNTGEEIVQVVCGGSNLYEKMVIAFAKPGASFIFKEEEPPVVIKQTKIRGQESNGMICAASELRLEKFFPMSDDYAVIDLSDLNFELGTPLANALDMEDFVFEVDNPSITHRPDLFSHRGFARECVANGLGTWKELPNLELPEASGSFPLNIDIKNKELVSRYSSIVINNVPVKDSPLWIKKRLDACGIRPISSHVDITNYVMLDVGMPSHAFDIDIIKGKNVTLRESAKGEQVTTLDGVTRTMPENTIVLEDEAGVFDLCGIMGGQRSSIGDETKNIWLHCAIFEKIRVRRSSLALGHRTDASTIFEKGVPTSSAIMGVQVAWKLIKEFYPQATLEYPVLDMVLKDEEKKVITISHEKINTVAGKSIDARIIKHNLEALGFGVVTNDENAHFEVEVPSHRYGDINIPEDVIEEVIRTYGLNQIEADLPMVPTEVAHLPEDKQLARIVRSRMVDYGFYEAYNYSFLGQELLEKCMLRYDESYAKVQNYITEDTSIMRQDLFPRLMENLEQNLRYQSSVRLYELSRVYHLVDGKPVENKRLTAVMCDENYDFYNAKGVVEVLMASFGVSVEYMQDQQCQTYAHPGRAAVIMCDGVEIGRFAEVHPRVLKNFDIDKRVAFIDIDYDCLVEYADPQKKYTALPKFPDVTLDMNLVIDKKTPAENYRKIIQDTDNCLITNVSVIDEYQGGQLPEDKRSVTYRVVYNASDRTLTEEEVQNVHEVVLTNVQKEGAELRS